MARRTRQDEPSRKFTPPTPRFIDLWRGNRVTGHYTMHMSDIAEKFAASQWAEIAKTQWPLERALRAFLTDTDGLNSVWEEKDYPDLHEVVRSRIFDR